MNNFNFASNLLKSILWFLVISLYGCEKTGCEIKIETGAIQKAGNNYLVVEGEIVELCQGIVEVGYMASLDNSFSVIVCKTSITNPSIGIINSTLNNYDPTLPYYVRAYAFDGNDYYYGNTISYFIENGIFIDDRDGHEYKWVKIGNQIWMAENLAYLPSINASSEVSFDIPRFYVYAYINGASIIEAKATSSYITYGVLYNGKAAINDAESCDSYRTDIQGACPCEWHLPSDDEWKELLMYLGMTQTEVESQIWIGTNQGTQLKASTGWDLEGNGSNLSGFTALPGGFFVGQGFSYEGIFGYWWSASKSEPNRLWTYGLGSDEVGVDRGSHNLSWAFSIRCVKD